MQEISRELVGRHHSPPVRPSTTSLERLVCNMYPYVVLALSSIRPCRPVRVRVHLASPSMVSNLASSFSSRIGTRQYVRLFFICSNWASVLWHLHSGRPALLRIRSTVPSTDILPNEMNDLHIPTGQRGQTLRPAYPLPTHYPPVLSCCVFLSFQFDNLPSCQLPPYRTVPYRTILLTLPALGCVFRNLILHSSLLSKTFRPRFERLLRTTPHAFIPRLNNLHSSSHSHCDTLPGHMRGLAESWREHHNAGSKELGGGGRGGGGGGGGL